MRDELRNDPQRWQLIQRLFEEGLPLTPTARRQMLQARCPDDEAVRREIETLLEGADATGDRLAVAVGNAVGGLFHHQVEARSGDHVGAYRIERRLGTGGMGAVYLAQRADHEFQRTVAIKIIRRDLVDRPDLLLRFRRERQILADLDHPNIARMLDGGVTEVGAPYFVMEYVDGQPILEYCVGRALPLSERLKLFSSVCEAVEYAHSQGVVHRDIKPSNILVSRDGTPKLLDFGIAKLVRRTPAGHAPIETATFERMMTPDYASPEILRGEVATESSDVYALGVLLYEMLAGRHPYREDGENSWVLFHGVGSGEALPPSSLQGGAFDTLSTAANRDLDAIVMRAMRSNAANRYPSVRLLAEDLRRFQAGLPVAARHSDRFYRLGKFVERRLTAGAGAVDHFIRRRPRLGWSAMAIAALAALLTAPAAYVHFREQRSTPTPVHFQIEPIKGTRFVNLALSPDGQRLAFVGMQTYGSDQLWVRALDELEPKPVPGSEGARGVPVWSPDSRFLAATTPGKLKKFDISGGPPQTICDMPNAMAGGFWSADGRIIFGTVGGGLSRADAARTCSPLTELSSARQETMHIAPVLLPDGQHFLYVIRGAPEHSGIYVGSLRDKPDDQVRRLLLGGNWIAYVPAQYGATGQLLVAREGGLFLQPLDEARLQLAGNPTLITANLAPVLSPAGVSANGVLAYQNAAGPRQVVWMDRLGNVLRTVGSTGLYNRLALSPEGTRLAVQIGEDSLESDLWLIDLERGVSERFTTDPHVDLDPLWRPDGAGIVFASNRAGRFDLFYKPAGGTVREGALLESAVSKYPVDISRDGRWLIYTQPSASSADDLWVYPLGEKGNASLLAGTEFAERLGVFSPDGRAVAYISDESGRFEVYVRPFPPAPEHGKRIVSSGGGTQPRWNPKGRELFYIAPDGTLMQVEVKLSPEFRASTPKPLFQTSIWSAGGVTNGHRWDIAPDGRHFLFNSATDPISQNLTVVLNWRANLKK